MRKPLDLGNRVLIIGCSGSGKTTLAKQLATIIGLPIIHLDKYYWEKDWVPISDADWQKRLYPLCQQSQWIMDGSYTQSIPYRLQYATSVIYLDIPRWQCLWRVFLRRLKIFSNRRRDDLPAKCQEQLKWNFFVWIWHYKQRSRENTLTMIKDFTGKSVVLTNQDDITQFLQQVKNPS